METIKSLDLVQAMRKEHLDFQQKRLATLKAKHSNAMEQLTALARGAANTLTLRPEELSNNLTIIGEQIEEIKSETKDAHQKIKRLGDTPEVSERVERDAVLNAFGQGSTTLH